MPRWAKYLGRGVGALIELGVRWYESRSRPPIRIDELHVGATTTDAVERERAAARAKWPDDVSSDDTLPRPPRVPRDGGAS